jgi:hypothetical protein
MQDRDPQFGLSPTSRRLHLVIPSCMNIDAKKDMPLREFYNRLMRAVAAIVVLLSGPLLEATRNGAKGTSRSTGR